MLTVEHDTLPTYLYVSSLIIYDGMSRLQMKFLPLKKGNQLLSTKFQGWNLRNTQVITC